MDRVRGDASVGKTLTLDEARRIANNIAKLPQLMRAKQKPVRIIGPQCN
jgi:hypothetical protein